jgi:hypothetical protein
MLWDEGKERMRPSTRDNLRLLVWGIFIAALMAADGLLAERYGLPSRFALRVPGYMALLDYFVIRETRRAKATLIQTAVCVAVASALHLGVAFAFRRTFTDRFGPGLLILVVLEFLGIVQLMLQTVQYFRRTSHHVS